jgi:hypothetical protein
MMIEQPIQEFAQVEPPSPPQLNAGLTSSQDVLLLRNLMQFYETPENMDKLVDMVNAKTQISLRIVDWFVTNYAKKYYTNYVIPIKTGIVYDTVELTKFKVYDKYKLQLKAYSKRRFDPFCRTDPFCRSEKILIPYGSDAFLETTLGQLNFFKWAIEYRVLDYIAENYEEIERDMNARNGGSKRNKKSGTESSSSGAETDAELASGAASAASSRNSTASSTTTASTSSAKTRKKRQELSSSACKCMIKEEFKVTVRFND